MYLNSGAVFEAFNAIIKAHESIKKNVESEGKEFSNEYWEWVVSRANANISQITHYAINHAYNPEFTKDFMLLAGEILSIAIDGKSREVKSESVYNSIKERILFLAGGEIRVWVNVYHTTREYGGAEEGGWWYDWTELVTAIPCSYDEAEKIESELRGEYGEGEGDISSALGGYEIDIRIEAFRGESASKERPQYC